ncbi:folylpolyglutamate synthase/dihydrofolate synthase family protein [Aliikangiella sp. G2MR2-5]|uniref:bifunctional folylpolyglutamate synthase/dihydrofolate synthase n=1 Tax=Aliikangiella sp. G2MR2-5 TaxID=2788943 RepID=UPI0018AABF01|nr:folylpolyglutamate synthase/dihydrofolate synthase family protein [Aliikangiella sp. G2MR2-5]
MQNKSLDQWLEHIESLHPADIELGLDRIRQVALSLDLLETTAKTVLVSGTNGKGSCCAMLESLALIEGLNVGQYTSPHLVRFNERIKVNGIEVSDEKLVTAFEVISSAQKDIRLTFFEFTTLSALWIFKQHNLDLIVMEIGLGGRLDACNIVEPDLSIITTIDIDHTDWLGSDLNQIAFEKAGIIRPDTPALVGDKRSFDLVCDNLKFDAKNVSLLPSPKKEFIDFIKSDTVNPYQLLIQNVALACQGLTLLFAKPIDLKTQKEALVTIRLNGRFQRLANKPTTIVDVGHNPQAAGQIREQLINMLERSRNSEKPVTRIVAICGMMADKSIVEVVSILDPLVDEWGFVDLPVPRAAKAKELKAIYENAGLLKSVKLFGSVKNAFSEMQTKLDEQSILLVFGSFITVGNLLEYLAKNNN